MSSDKVFYPSLGLLLNSMTFKEYNSLQASSYNDK